MDVNAKVNHPHILSAAEQTKCSCVSFASKAGKAYLESSLFGVSYAFNGSLLVGVIRPTARGTLLGHVALEAAHYQLRLG